MKITAPKILLLELVIILYGNIIKDVIPSLSIIMFFPDLLNMIVLVFIFKKMRKVNKYQKWIVFIICSLLCYDFIRGVFSKTDFVLLLWGIRNQYRFFIFLLGCIFFLKEKDLIKIEKIFQHCFVINVFAVTIDFLLGYTRDYCGGTFGIGHNCNSCAMMFMCIVCTYTVYMWLKKLFTIKKLLFVLICSLYWATIAEIKAFYIWFLLIILGGVVFCNASVNKKIKIIVMCTIGMVSAVFMLSKIFPEQIEYILKYGLIGYAKGINAGIYGFGRTTAIKIANERMFKNNPLYILFGIGTGNAEFLDIGSIKLYSSFYNSYKDFGYSAIFYAFIYIERGFLGLGVYLIIFFKSMVIALRNTKKEKVANNIAVDYQSVCMPVLIILICIYDSSLRISSAGYLAFFMLSVPYWINNSNFPQASDSANLEKIG